MMTQVAIPNDTIAQWARMHFYWTKFITNLILELYSLKLV